MPAYLLMSSDLKSRPLSEPQSPPWLRGFREVTCEECWQGLGAQHGQRF